MSRQRCCRQPRTARIAGRGTRRGRRAAANTFWPGGSCTSPGTARAVWSRALTGRTYPGELPHMMRNAVERVAELLDDLHGRGRAVREVELLERLSRSGLTYARAICSQSVWSSPEERRYSDSGRDHGEDEGGQRAGRESRDQQHDARDQCKAGEDTEQPGPPWRALRTLHRAAGPGSTAARSRGTPSIGRRAMTGGGRSAARLRNPAG
jgi:hypothetical protein